ncbi:MAG: hypothetical protein E4H28_00720 [Gemmatimonadales bacterium]|nr:MAG: hypothetical protein E4H28_00720 [Gemmatimonadales bacterium]
MKTAVWRLTWTLTVRRRRLLIWNVAVPILLLVPVVTSSAAPAHRAVVVAVFVTFFGAYGSCIPLIRDGMTGWAEKVWLTGYGGRRWLVEGTLASVAVDWVQLLPVNVLLSLLSGMSAGATLVVLIATALALLFANLLGVFVAALVRALGEAALGCAVVSLFALHLSGVFRNARPGSWWETIEAWNPLRPLHESWVAALSGGPNFPWESVVFPIVYLGAVMLGTILVGNLLATRIAATGTTG